VSEPSEESLTAVTRFARETGDVHALSTVDLKVIALAHTLEVAAHGSGHLREHPVKATVRTKHRSSAKALPGWGSVPNPEDWKVVDEADDHMGHGSSRIAQQVQQLHLDPATDTAPTTSSAAPAAAVGGPANTSAIQQQLQVYEPLSRSGGNAEEAPSSSGKLLAGDAAAAAAAGFNASSSADLPAAAGEGSRDGGDTGWEVVASSKTAGRRHKRKQHKREQWQQAFEEEWQDHATSMQQQQQDGVVDGDAVMAADTPAAAGLAPAAAAEQQEQQSSDVVMAANPSADAAGLIPPVAATAAEQQQQEQHSDQEHSSNEEEEDGGHNGEAYSTEDMSDSEEELDETDTGVVETDDGTTTTGLMSSIATITADFAMQNVILQMGLRLLAKDGRQIQKLSRWALRCSACFTVTREMGRLFCPKCGNMTMDKVEVAVGADGAEVYGVKKQHILRGTKYSLPKPKGGRNNKQPVLREDVFLQKVKALGGLKAKKPAAAAADVDPFAPEFGVDTWHRSQQELAQHRGLATLLQPTWKSNPNQRKLTRSNRRG